MVNEKVYARLSAYMEDKMIMKRKKKKRQREHSVGSPPTQDKISL